MRQTRFFNNIIAYEKRKKSLRFVALLLAFNVIVTSGMTPTSGISTVRAEQVQPENVLSMNNLSAEDANLVENQMTDGYEDIDFGFTQEEMQLLQRSVWQDAILENGKAGSKQESKAVYDAPKRSRLSLADEGLSVERAEETLPSAYTLEQAKQNLPQLRNQNPYGCCWSFSALGSCEASLIRKGLADHTIDLSERHLAYYFYYKGAQTADPLRGTLGDYNKNMTSTNYLSIGGNSMLTIWHLASWCGPVEEANAPYAGLTSNNVDLQGLMGQENSTKMAYETDAYHLQNAYVISIGNSYQDTVQRDTVKQLILEYGALGMSYYSDKSKTYDNAENDCYYYDGPNKYKTNHAIMVVGWDDNFSKENFNVGHQPEGDGAWLMRNSWGEEDSLQAQYGYFWLSYYDYGLRDNTGATTKYAFVFDCESADNYDHIYQHDGDAGHRRMGVGSTSYKLKEFANVYTAKGKEGYQEKLEAIGIGVSSVGVSYTAEVYVDLKNEADPTSGTLAAQKEGTIPFNGYHTIVLNQPITLEYGQKYAVVFRFEEGAYVYASRSTTVSGTWEFITQNETGQSFAKDKSSDAWMDCANNEKYDSCNLRIKAYTMDTDDPVGTPIVLPSISPKPSEQPSTAPSATPSTSPSATPSTAPSATPSTSPSATPSASPSATPSTSPSATPSASPSATPTTLPSLQPSASPSAEPSNTAGPTKQPQDTVVTNLISLSLNQSSAKLVKGKKLQLTAAADYDRETTMDYMVYWKSSNERVATVSESGEVTALCPGKTVVTVYHDEVADTCTVYVLPKKQEILRCFVSGDKLKLSLKPQTGVDGYVLYRSTTEKGTYKKVKTIKNAPAATYTLAAVKGKKNYYYKARSYVTIDGKRYFGAFSMVCSRVPQQVTMTKVIANHQAVTLKWNRAKRAAKYAVYRSKQRATGYQEIALVSKDRSRKYCDKTIQKGETYYYKVAGVRKISGQYVYGPYSDVYQVVVDEQGNIMIE